MDIKNDTNTCFVFLTGILNTLPKHLFEKNKDEAIIILKRNRFCTKKLRFEVDCFRVLIKKPDIQKLLKVGFSGMQLSIFGELQIEDEIEAMIVAKKINWFDYSNSNQPEECLNGSTRKKLLEKNNFCYLH